MGDKGYALVQFFVGMLMSAGLLVGGFQIVETVYRGYMTQIFSGEYAQNNGWVGEMIGSRHCTSNMKRALGKIRATPKRPLSKNFWLGNNKVQLMRQFKKTANGGQMVFLIEIRPTRQNTLWDGTLTFMYSPRSGATRSYHHPISFVTKPPDANGLAEIVSCNQAPGSTSGSGRACADTCAVEFCEKQIGATWDPVAKVCLVQQKMCETWGGQWVGGQCNLDDARERGFAALKPCPNGILGVDNKGNFNCKKPSNNGNQKLECPIPCTWKTNHICYKSGRFVTGGFVFLFIGKTRTSSICEDLSKMNDFVKSRTWPAYCKPGCPYDG